MSEPDEMAEKLQHESEATVPSLAAMADRLDRLRSEQNENMLESYAAGAMDERKAIVAWLRADGGHGWGAAALAHVIERGEHLEAAK